MMTSFYNLLKYVATGIASPDMTYYDKMRASTLMGGAVQTLTGQPPLSFKSNGKPLISWSMKGNGSQSGTPTHDAPIQPEFVGARTGNLMPVTSFTGKSNSVMESFNLESTNIVFEPNTQYTISLDFSANIQTGVFKVTFYYTDETSTSSYWMFGNSHRILISDSGKTISALKITDYSQYTDVELKNIMLNLGSTDLPYEPYGYKIPITCAGQTTPVYLGQTQTVRKIRKLIVTANLTFIKGNSNPSEYTYYFFFSSNSLPVAAEGETSDTRAIFTHLKYGYYAAGTGAVSGNGLIVYLNFGASIMNAQASGNTVDGLKEYLASEYQAGTPVTMWYILSTPTTGIVNEPLAKIGTYADELHSTDAGVTIPTANGANTLTVETDLQPSEISITYRE